MSEVIKIVPKSIVVEKNLDAKLSGHNGLFTNEEYICNLKRHGVVSTMPDEDYKGAHISIYHKCLIHNFRFKAQPNNVMNGYPCPLCVKEQKRIKKENEYIQNLINRDIQVKLDDKYISYSEKVYHICLTCGHRWKTSPKYIFHNVYPCPICAKKFSSENRKISYDDFVKRIYNIFQDKIIITGKYNGITERIDVHCNLCGYDWSPIADSLSQRHGCPNCKNIKTSLRCRKTIEEYKKQLSEISDSIIVCSDEYINSWTPIKHECKICNCIFYAIPNNLLQKKKKCPNCVKKFFFKLNGLSNEEFVERVHNRFPSIKLLEEYKGASMPIKCECLICGHLWEIKRACRLYYNGCPRCSASHLELEVEKYLIERNITFESPVKYDGLVGVKGKKLSYDFGIFKNSILIECQGEQHERAVEHFGGKKQFVKQQIHDIRKRRYAKEHGIKLITIWYDQIDEIPQILDNYLNNLILESVETATPA